MKRTLLALMLVILWCSSAVAASTSWQWRSALPQANALYDITYGGGQFVAVGDGGAVVTSPDGKAWAWHPAGVAVSLRSVSYGDGRYVAVGAWQASGGAQGSILTSSDGVNWKHTEMGPGSSFTGIAYGNGQFVAVGAGGPEAGSTVFTSSDGQSWTRSPAHVADGVQGIAYGAGRFVAFRPDEVVVTEDGNTWTAGRLPAASGILRLVHTGTEFAGVGVHLLSDNIHQDSVLLRSTDGQDWTMQTVGQQRPSGVTYADGQYLATAAGGVVQTSTDGAAWQTYSTAATTELNAIACGGGACVAVGGNGKLVTATDRIHWTDLGVTPSVMSANGLTYGNGQFIAVKRMDAYISQDGEQWTRLADDHGPLLSIHHANGHFFADSDSGIGKPLLVSDDGRSWRALDYGQKWVGGGVAYGRGRYVLSSQASPPKFVTVLGADLKPLGVTPNPDPGFVSSLVYGKGLFVAVGGDHIAYSADGVAWTPAASLPGDGGALYQVAYGGGRFVAAGGRDAGLLYTSPDGKQWTKVEPGGSQLLGVIYGGGRFLAWNQASILTSADGEHWTTEPNRAGAALFAYGAGKFIAVGAGGTLMTAAGCGARFPDVAADHPACDAVEQLWGRQIVSGNPDGTFRPDTALTRAEVAKMLALTLGLEPDPQGRQPFSDSAGHWAAHDGYLQAAVSAGIINGFPDGTFRPDAPVLRGELTKMVAAAVGLKQEAGTGYTDIKSSDWFAGWAGAARSADLIGSGGYHPLWGGADFRGGTAATRGDTAILLDNLTNH